MPAIDNHECEYLFHQVMKQRAHTCVPHDHPFWQIEVCIAGHLIATVQDESQPILPGCAVVIPPGHMHAFKTCGRPCEWLSIKFLYDQNDPPGGGVWAEGPVVEGIIASLIALIPQPTELGNDRKLVTGNLLAALMRHLYPSRSPRRTGDALIDRIAYYISSNITRPISVAEIAQAMDYSSRYLGNLYHKSTGTHLKTAVDQARADYAAKLLRYGDGSITDIAEQLGFADVYAFSRFFRRVIGASPSHYRSQADTHRFGYDVNNPNQE